MSGLNPAPRARGGRVVAVCAVLVLVVAACGDSGGEVTAGAAAGSTTGAASVATTAAPATGAPTTTVPATPVGVTVDPEQYVSEAKLADLAALGEESIPLPTWVPEWAADVTPVIGTVENVDVVFAHWSLDYNRPYAQEIGQGDIIIELYRARLTPEDTPLTGPTAAGAVRTYTLTPAAIECYEGGEPGPIILQWDEGGFRHGVAMQPEPPCYPADFSIAQAVAFADSLVACDPTGPTLECEAAPAR